MTTTLREQRLINIHHLGRRDAQDGKPAIPQHGASQEEQDMYLAGYRGERKRMRVDVESNVFERFLGQR